MAVATLVPLAEPWRAGPFPAITVHGALGHALRDTVCVRPGEPCEPCPYVGDCMIPGWLKQLPTPPYAIAVHGSEAEIRLRVVAFGDVPRSTALIAAIHRMAAAGLGPERAPYRVARIDAHGDGAPTVVSRDGRDVGRWPAPGALVGMAVVPPRARGLSIDVLTPFSHGHHDRPPEITDLVNAAVLRVRALARACGREIEHRWPECPPGSWDVRRRVSVDRRSWSAPGRQNLSGWLGRVRLTEAFTPWFDVLAAAAIVQVGRGTTRGQGQLVLTWHC